MIFQLASFPHFVTHSFNQFLPHYLTHFHSPKLFNKLFTQRFYHDLFTIFLLLLFSPKLLPILTKVKIFPIFTNLYNCYLIYFILTHNFPIKPILSYFDICCPISPLLQLLDARIHIGLCFLKTLFTFLIHDKPFSPTRLLWAESVIESPCPSVRMSGCLSVCHQVQFFFRPLIGPQVT